MTAAAEPCVSGPEMIGPYPDGHLCYEWNMPAGNTA